MSKPLSLAALILAVAGPASALGMSVDLPSLHWPEVTETVTQDATTDCGPTDLTCSADE